MPNYPYDPINSLVEVETREKINGNWQKIESDIKSISGDVLAEVINGAKLTWKEPVDSFADLATTYPDAEEGWTAFVRNSGTNGETYRFDGTDWLLIQEFDGTAINEVDNRLTSQLADIATNVKSFGAKGDGVTDDTLAIQNAIDEVSARGGGFVKIPAGTFIASNIFLKSYVSLVGTGRRSTIKQKNNSSGALLQLFSPSEQMVGVENVRLDGNKENQIESNGGVDFTNTYDYATMINASSVGEHDSRHFFNNVYIYKTKGTAFTITGRGESQIINVQTLQCDGEGFSINVPDSFFLNCSAGDSGFEGFMINVGNNRFVNCKAWYSGRLDQNNHGDGFVVIGDRTALSACESQDNAKHGFVFKAKGVVGSSLIAESNGFLWDPGNITGTRHVDGTGFVFYGAQNCVIQGAALDRFDGTPTGIHQSYGIQILKDTVVDRESLNNSINVSVNKVFVSYIPSAQLPNSNNYYNIFWMRNDGTISKISSTFLTASATLNFPTISAYSTAVMTVALQGVVPGNTVVANPTSAGMESGLIWSAWVSSNNTVSIQLANVTGSAISPPSRGWRVSRLN